MFANLIQLITRRAPSDYDLAFIKEVAVHAKPVRNPRVERLILVCWMLIAGKCWLVRWLVEKYRVPIDPMWVIAPTLAFALLCTLIYFRRQ